MDTNTHTHGHDSHDARFLDEDHIRARLPARTHGRKLAHNHKCVDPPSISHSLARYPYSSSSPHTHHTCIWSFSRSSVHLSLSSEPTPDRCCWSSKASRSCLFSFLRTSHLCVCLRPHVHTFLFTFLTIPSLHRAVRMANLLIWPHALLVVMAVLQQEAAAATVSTPCRSATIVG